MYVAELKTVTNDSPPIVTEMSDGLLLEVVVIERVGVSTLFGVAPYG